MHIYDKDTGYYNSTYSEQILESLLNQNIPNPTTHKVREVINFVKRETFERTENNNHHICLNNGLLNLKTFQIEKHTPDRFLTYRVPVNYNKDVDMEPWLKFVNSLTKEAKTLQEATGNIFADHYITKKLLYVFGPRDSGKSTYFDIIQAFLTENNYCNLSLNQLGEKFTNAGIFNKRANIYSDIPYRVSIKYYGVIKSFTGGDKVTIQFKHKTPFPYKNMAFPHNFVPNDSIFKTYTTPDMFSAILNWMIEGYRRLKENKWILTNNTTIDEAQGLFMNAMMKDSTLLQWLIVRCNPALTGWELKKVLFDDCVDWCKDKGLVPPINLIQFGKLMSKQQIIPLEDYNPLIDGKQHAAFRGVILNV